MLLAWEVMQSPPSIHPLLTFEPSDLWLWPFACIGYDHSSPGI